MMIGGFHGGRFLRGAGALPRLLAAVVAISLLVAGVQAFSADREHVDLAAGADGVLLGTVRSVESGLSADGAIMSTARVSAEIVVAGTFPPGDVAVGFRGGTVDGVTQVAGDEPALAPGDRAVLLLDATPEGYRVHGGRRGVIPVVDGAVWIADGEGTPVAVPASAYAAALTGSAEDEGAPVLSGGSAAASGGPAIASVSPPAAPAGTGTTITITGAGFGTKASRSSRGDVGFVYRSTSPTAFVPAFATGRPRYESNADGIVSWSDTRIVVRVPAGRMADGYDGSASSGRVWVVTDAGASSPAVPFAVTFGWGGRTWARPARFVVNPACPGVPGARAAVSRAASTWNAAVAGSSFRFVDGGATASTATGRDGRNLVCWRPPSAFADPGMVAVTDWWYVGSALVECDVRLNTAFAWTDGTASGGTRSIEAVMLHEFGHWIGLRDLYGYGTGMPTDVGKVMFGTSNAGFGNLNRRTLGADDVAGARYALGVGAPAATPAGAAIPGGAGPPRDLDGDGRYEDLSGNGRAEFGDVVLFFRELAWIAAHEPLAPCDLSGNGRVDYADVVRLFERL